MQIILIKFHMNLHLRKNLRGKKQQLTWLSILGGMCEAGKPIIIATLVSGLTRPSDGWRGLCQPFIIKHAGSG